MIPVMQQDKGRGGGSSNENRRSLTDFLGVDTTCLARTPATPQNMQPNNVFNAEGRWHWEKPRSPPVAQSPSAVVLAACFPQSGNSFASYSESARLGTGWDDVSSASQGITDLLSSLALAMPSSATPTHNATSNSTQLRSYQQTDASNVQAEWAVSAYREENYQRRASFCGVLTSIRSGEAARWSGVLPARSVDVGGDLSAKVFLGGLPWDISEQSLLHALRQFHPKRVEWPGRERDSGAGGAAPVTPRGYAYVTLESDQQVRSLLAASRRDGPDWYYRVASRKMRSKEVQVIPWLVSDSNWVVGGSVRLEPARTVFVGALHGMLSAAALAHIMNDLFDGVVYAGIDTDKNKYPIGSGRITFNNVRSYVRAISAAYVEIRTDKFTKKVQVDPYLEDSMCSLCKVQQGPYFCRDPICFRYFCRSCWAWQHCDNYTNHKPLMRNSKNSQITTNSLSGYVPSNGQRHSLHGDQGSGFTGSNEGTQSPSTSGTSGSSEPEPAAPCEESHNASWTH